MALLKMKFTQHRRVRLAQGLWLLSWMAVLCGSFVFSLGVYLKIELLRRSEVMENTEIHVVPNILMLVGLASIGTNWVAGRACQDSMDPSRFPRWKFLLLGWYAVAALLCCLLIAVVVLSYALQGRLEESLKVGLRNGIRFYKDTDVPGRCFQKETIDRLQMEFRCCGNTNFRDWFEVQWVSNRYLDYTSKDIKDRIRSNIDGRYLLDGVPFSCCNPASPRPCLQYHLTDNSAHYNYDFQNEELNLYNRGCRQALIDYYMDLMNSTGPGVLSVILIQMSVLLSLRYLQTSVEGAMAQEQPEGVSEGFLLEKGVKETLEEAKVKILLMLKFGQVDPDAAEGSPDAEKAPPSSS
ncbi:rod outer segment membrane protein 1b isoform X1 [Syngnathoides biaculeatus]|uniref:rod outer segment membrane protein 1b isoform X1 n=2 Tax=Syngnathoides biaculeatus TaxID=300417 RepID=UPI002ADD7E52|nr:rod outer segment membrane protein 1b isoform X1 [Syngnathoides biaculeatus]XP_061690180.1 rod outer segment membrane protein 1b isoform X1 [Syngnathoides biaculeatus]